MTFNLVRARATLEGHSLYAIEDSLFLTCKFFEHANELTLPFHKSHSNFSKQSFVFDSIHDV